MRIVLVVLGALALSGCSVKRELTATGGSRADGTVTLSYEIGDMQKAVLSQERGLATAQARCRAWGYSGAQKFGGESRQCQVPSSYGCIQWLVSVTYQCTGGKVPT